MCIVHSTLRDATSPYTKRWATFNMISKKLIIILTCVCILISLESMTIISEDLNGEYLSAKDHDQVDLIINDDKTYTRKWTTCMFQYTAKGTWKINHDTLLLHQETIKYKYGFNKTPPLNKYLIQQDTLFTLYFEYGEYKKWIPLIKKK